MVPNVNHVLEAQSGHAGVMEIVRYKRFVSFISFYYLIDML